MLTVSTFLETGSPVAAMMVLSGSVAGLIVVLNVVRRFKRPQPGLPYIGLGAALGWVASTLLV
jgi:presenilin-like A22 family membrane protease